MVDVIFRGASGMSNGKQRNVGDVESQPNEETSLLPGSPTLRRPSYRARRLSNGRGDSGNETTKRRWWSGVVAGIIGLSCILIAIGLIVSRERDGRHRDGNSGNGGGTPDYSKLPPPKDGLRNPAYLMSGYNGAVATEVDVCSQIGVDGT